MEQNYTKVCNSLLKNLPDRTKEIIVRRFGLKGEKESLEAIGQSHGITRERVRQIEADGLSIIQEKSVKYQDVFSYFLKTLDSLGGIKKTKDFISIFSKEENQIAFLLYLTKEIEKKPENKDYFGFYYNKDKKIAEVYKTIDKVIAYLKKKKKPLTLDEIKADFKIVNLETYFDISKKIKKDPEGRVGLKNWLEIDPKGIKDKAYLIFQKIGKPLHFTQVAELIENSPFVPEGKKIYVTTVHNELIKDSRFVLVGRGIYALKEWGYQPGVVKDIIIDLLKKQGPLPKEAIFANVLKKRFVQENTIYLNLQDKQKFLRDEKGKYFFKEVKEA